jgi:hypothetical protein
VSPNPYPEADGSIAKATRSVREVSRTLVKRKASTKNPENKPERNSGAKNMNITESSVGKPEEGMAPASGG